MRQTIPEGLDHMKRIHTGAVSKELQPGKESGGSYRRDPTQEQCVEGCVQSFSQGGRSSRDVLS